MHRTYFIHSYLYTLQGYEHVANIEGGYSAWVDAGFAGDKSAAELKTACRFRPTDN